MIRKAQIEDLEVILAIYEEARTFMRKTGNFAQWVNGYPSAGQLREDMRNGYSFVCENEQNRVVGSFCFFQGIEPNYLKIVEGRWQNDLPYGVIHRLASDGSAKGLADHCFAWCFAQCSNIRVDTHQDNTVMQHILQKNGFVRCGTIFVEDGTPRIAFQKTL